MSDFRVIPSIEALRHREAVLALEARHGAAATTDALRAEATALRQAIAAGDASIGSEAAAASWIERAATARLIALFRPSLRRVINATGVIVHTNLGRAPLADAALARVAIVGRGYSSLEYDVDAGTRGRRDTHAEALLVRLTGAEAAIVVNNNAAATLLVLAAIAWGRDVLVSRGELVEIGGGFRVPDVMAQSGAVLREVGTTNKTRVADYAAALNEHTALILRVHPSNFRIEGFTERPDVKDLVALGRRFNVPVGEDLGSGLLDREAPIALATTEPTVTGSIAAGVDLCWFSGDKLLGGPQAGIIVGRKALVDRVRTHPLMRALRVDKLTYAALEATLAEYAVGRADNTVPVRRMLFMTTDTIRGRADRLADAVRKIGTARVEVMAGTSTIGGGSAPGIELPTWLVSIAVPGLTPDALDAKLRAGDPPVVGRIEEDQVVLDLRTVLPDDDGALAELVTRALA